MRVQSDEFQVSFSSNHGRLVSFQLRQLRNSSIDGVKALCSFGFRVCFVRLFCLCFVYYKPLTSGAIEKLFNTYQELNFGRVLSSLPVWNSFRSSSCGGVDGVLMGKF